jgi:TonB-dependent starch-binding outer membrane protein SusC
MRRRQKILQKITCTFLLCAILGINCLLAFPGFKNKNNLLQTWIISGKVSSENGLSLQGVTVLVKGTAKSTLTDANGYYTIDVPETSGILIFSFIGTVSKELKFNGPAQINVTLANENKELDDVIVIGYGTQRKKDLTGAVASVKSKNITAVPVTSAEQILQGRISGVQVTQGSSAPGGGVTLRIRGSNSVNAGNEPLYVIDGFPVYSSNSVAPTGVGERSGINALSSINTNDIESIEVLKDASAAAIYGSRGANGVVLITTKRGKNGQNKININSYYGVQNVINRYSLMNNKQLAAYGNAYGQSLATPVTPYAAVPATNTDWQKEVFGQGQLQNHSLAFSGGNNGTNYLVSGEYYGEKGAVVGSKFNRGSFRFNLDKVFSKRLKFGNSLTISRAVTDVSDILYQTLSSRPFTPVLDQDGNYFLDKGVTFGGQAARIDNPVGLGKQKINKTIVTRGIGNLYGEFNINESLTARTMLGTDISYMSGRGFSPRTTLEGLDQLGVANLSSVENVSWLNENTLTYKRKFGTRHNLTALAGNSFQRQNVLNYGIRRGGFPTDATSYYTVVTGANDRNYSPSGSYEFSILSYFGRINYTLDNKYLFTFTGRSDGSSKFGEGKKYGFFPSGAFAWRVSDENFMRKIKNVSDLKIRTSYGVTGNQEIPPYRSLSILRSDRGQVIGGEQVTGFNATSDMANPNLGWEQTSQLDLGLDLGLFGDRVTITADYYQKTTSDLLFQSPVPVETGYGYQWRNIGKVKNTGFEFAVNTQNIKGAFSWTTEANFSINSNKVISLDPKTPLNADGSRQILANLFQNESGGIDGLSVIRTGKPLGSFYTYVFDGIWQSQEEITAAGAGFSAYKPGDIKYKDINNDKKIDGNDRTITGNGIPKFLYGINNTLSYKNFEFTFFIQGSAKVNVVNLTRYNLDNSIGGTNAPVERSNFWSTTNKTNSTPRPGPTDFLLTNKYIEDGSYLRLRTVSLMYKIPVSKWKSKVISGFNVYATAQNLFTITNYSGYDPEVNIAGQSQALQGIDLYSYPSQKRFLVGVNLTF